MKAQLQKQSYIKFWKQIQTQTDEGLLKTTKLIQWIKLLQDHEILLIQKQLKKNKANNKKQMKPQQQGKQVRQTIGSIKQKQQNSLKSTSKPAEQAKQHQAATVVSVQVLSIQQKYKAPLQQTQIYQYINRYAQSAHYKVMAQAKTKNQTKQQTTQTKEKQKQDVKNNKTTKNKGKKIVKDVQPLINDNLIELCYQQAVFFYYWLKSQRLLDMQLELEKLKAKELQQALKIQNQKKKQAMLSQKKGDKSVRVQVYVPLIYSQLNQSQLHAVTQQSLLSLHSEQPKLLLIFKHYCQLHLLQKTKSFSSLTFQEKHQNQLTLNLHQLLLWAKDYYVVNGRNVKDVIQGKVTKQFIMHAYYKNSFNRKHMTFQMFRRFLILLAGRMFHNQDCKQAKPIDLLINFLDLKHQMKFIQRIKQIGIKYSQSDLLNCFKDKQRKVFSKINVVKVKQMINTTKQRSSNSLANMTTKKLSVDMNRLRNEVQTNRQGFNKQFEQTKFLPRHQSSSALTLPQISSSTSLSKQHISKNSFPHFNHLNKFKQYLEESGPSSSVLKNKITGYSNIYNLQQDKLNQIVSRKHQYDHQRLAKLIGTKLVTISNAQRKNLLPTSSQIFQNHKAYPQPNNQSNRLNINQNSINQNSINQNLQTSLHQVMKQNSQQHRYNPEIQRSVQKQIKLKDEQGDQAFKDSILKQGLNQEDKILNKLLQNQQQYLSRKHLK